MALRLLVLVTACGGRVSSSEPSGPSSAEAPGTGPTATATATATGTRTATSPSSTPSSAPSTRCLPPRRPESTPPMPAADDRAEEWKEAFVLDADACASKQLVAALPFGSAWIRVRGTISMCEVWLGGETENPRYDGSPTQFCSFARKCTEPVRFELGRGGPARIDHPACTIPR